MNKLQQLERELAQLPPDHPQRRAALVPAMQALQAERGHLDDAAVEDVARLTGLSTIEVEELATFYNLIYRRPVGRHLLLVCDSVCCTMNGGEQLLAAAVNSAGVPLGEVSRDGAITVLPSICLGLCDQAPAALLDGKALGPLDEAAMQALILQLLQQEEA